jgi:Pyridoxamine 5'-phosphate oxidase
VRAVSAGRRQRIVRRPNDERASPPTSTVGGQGGRQEGDDVLFSTITGRRKTTNMLRDPRVNLLVHSVPIEDEVSTYATISGTAELTDDPDGLFHQVMYDIHMGGATPPPEPGAERMIVRIRPQKVYVPPAYLGTPSEYRPARGADVPPFSPTGELRHQSRPRPLILDRRRLIHRSLEALRDGRRLG